MKYQPSFEPTRRSLLRSMIGGSMLLPGIVSQLLAENQHFRMHEELGTGPGFYYLWDKKEEA